jgi:hypothetical protein
VKFQCENCGRSYLAGEDVRGRAFRMRCKQCGHVIVVKPEAGAVPLAPELAPELARMGERAPEVPKPPPPVGPPTPSAADLLRSAALAGGPGEACRGARGFDPFGEDPPWANGTAHANGTVLVADNGHAHGAQVPAFAAAHDEAEAAFAALDAELSGEERRDAAPASGGSHARPVSVSTAAGALPAEDEARLGPVELGPVSVKRRLTSLRAGLAVLLALGAGVFLLLRGSPRPPAPALQASQPRAAASSAPGAQSAGTAPAPVRPEPAAHAAPKPVEPHPARAEPAPARPKASHPAEKHAKPKEPELARTAASGPSPSPAPAAPRAEPARNAVAEAPRPAAADAPAAARSRPSDPKVIAATVQKHAHLFQACAADAAKDEPQLDVVGRRVELILTVSPSGGALYPTLDDVQLGETQLGRCLKDAGRKMQFPPFDGPSERVHVPLTLER